MNITKQNSLPFLRRLYIYQKERFPLLGHGLLVAAFSFSAISYSRICRGLEGFVSWDKFAVAITTTITLFFLVRVFDEFKDAEDDARYRKELPVPRGLISFRELFYLGTFAVLIQLTVNILFFPQMLWIYFVVIAYLCLMGKEFFIGDWLRRHQFWYVVSHMMIIPLVDVYASGFDWLLEGKSAPTGLLFFFAVSFMNGVVLEIGRKIKMPEHESEGVLTYSSLLGATKSTWLWIGILLVTLALSICASIYAGHGNLAFIVLSLGFALCVLPAILFLQNKTTAKAKFIEYASAAWTLIMYLTLGGIPMLTRLLS